MSAILNILSRLFLPLLAIFGLRRGDRLKTKNEDLEGQLVGKDVENEISHLDNGTIADRLRKYQQ